MIGGACPAPRLASRCASITCFQVQMSTSLYVNFGQTATRSARELRPWQTDDGSGLEATHVHGLMYNLSSLTSLPLPYTHIGLHNQQDDGCWVNVGDSLRHRPGNL